MSVSLHSPLARRRRRIATLCHEESFVCPPSDRSSSGNMITDNDGVGHAMKLVNFIMHDRFNPR